MGLEEENVVKLNTDGSVLKCAKDYSTSDCEYTAGSKICGKCGASAIELKESPMEQAIANDETLDDEDAVLIKALEEKASVMDEVSEVEAEKRRIEKDTRDTSDTQLEDDDDDPDDTPRPLKRKAKRKAPRRLPRKRGGFATNY